MYTSLKDRHGENLAAGNRTRVFTRVKNHFIKKPSWYYSMSIAATWMYTGQ
jgi:hypothetical protein